MYGVIEEQRLRLEPPTGCGRNQQLCGTCINQSLWMCLANHKIAQISTRFPDTIGKSGWYHCILKFYRGARGERRGSERS